MNKNVFIRFIAVTIQIFIVLLLNIPLRCSAESSVPENSAPRKKPAIGIIRFSVDVWDKQKKVVDDERTRAEMEFKKHLNDSSCFDKILYTPNEVDIISYSDISDPDVTIDPLGESRANKKLKDMCEKHKLSAVIFGHFQEYSDVIVVFRCYFHGDNLPKDKKIFSTEPIKIRTDEDFEKNLKKAVDVSKLKIENKLEEVFGLKSSFKEEKEANRDDTEEDTTENRNPDKINSDEKEPVNNHTKKDVGMKVNGKPPLGLEEEPNNSVESGESPMTANDVYRMIFNHGFYCETVDGPFHKEALRGIPKPENGMFKCKRDIKGIMDKDTGLVRTESTSLKGDRDKITLYWPQSSEIDMSNISFQEAEDTIKTLNQDNGDKTKRWRIPTIIELFSIVNDGSNHFPAIFEFQNQKEDLIFWTYTPVKKDGTKLDGEKGIKSYFVIRDQFLKKNIYSLTFAKNDIEGNAPQKAILLPVYSDTVYHYKTQPSGKQNDNTDNKTVGIDNVKNKNSTKNAIDKNQQDEKILGFDDTKSEDVKSHEPQQNSPNSPIDKKKAIEVPKQVPQSTSPVATSNQTSKSSSDDKILGFDDVPEREGSEISKTNNTEKPLTLDTHFHRYYARDNKELKIVIFPYALQGMLIDVQEQELMDYIEEIEKDLIRFQKESNFQFSITKKDLRKNSDISKITGLFNILENNNINNIIKIKQIREEMTAVEKMDIIIGIKLWYKSSSAWGFKFFFINLYDWQSLKKPITLALDKHDLKDFKEKIRNFIAELFTSCGN